MSTHCWFRDLNTHQPVYLNSFYFEPEITEKNIVWDIDSIHFCMELFNYKLWTSYLNEWTDEMNNLQFFMQLHTQVRYIALNRAKPLSR